MQNYPPRDGYQVCLWAHLLKRKESPHGCVHHKMTWATGTSSISQYCNCDISGKCIYIYIVKENETWERYQLLLLLNTKSQEGRKDIESQKKKLVRKKWPYIYFGWKLGGGRVSFWMIFLLGHWKLITDFLKSAIARTDVRDQRISHPRF